MYQVENEEKRLQAEVESLKDSEQLLKSLLERKDEELQVIKEINASQEQTIRELQSGDNTASLVQKVRYMGSRGKSAKYFHHWCDVR